MNSELPTPCREIPEDFGMELGEGRVWEGSSSGMQLHEILRQNLPFSRGIDRCGLEIHRHSGRAAGPLGLAAFMNSLSLFRDLRWLPVLLSHNLLEELKYPMLPYSQASQCDNLWWNISLGPSRGLTLP